MSRATRCLLRGALRRHLGNGVSCGLGRFFQRPRLSFCAKRLSSPGGILCIPGRHPDRSLVTSRVSLEGISAHSLGWHHARGVYTPPPPRRLVGGISTSSRPVFRCRASLSGVATQRVPDQPLRVTQQGRPPADGTLQAAYQWRRSPAGVLATTYP